MKSSICLCTHQFIKFMLNYIEKSKVKGKYNLNLTQKYTIV